MNKNFLMTVVVAAVVSVGSFALINKVWEKEEPAPRVRVEHHDDLTYTSKSLFTANADGEIVPLDFTATAAKSMPAIVQITSKVPYSTGESARELNPFEEFFRDDFFFRRDQPEEQPREREEHYGVGMGSGVIINEKGYIVTNNHVIENAKEVEVTLDNNQRYKAKVIGTDPTTDLGLIKIDENNLPILKLVNSDDVEIGEWVLALGHPLSLSKTVTAGIVSAKGRSIDILRQQGDQQYAIESFIQTDAAINKGNSGGALVNLNGDLIGINSAIASPTGYYSGYGFAIPSNLVNKVVEDLMKYGEVHRGVLGVNIVDLTSSNPYVRNIADSLDQFTGVYIPNVLDNSPAKKAGVKEGDIIIGVDEREVQTSPQLLEYVGLQHPGDEVTLRINRDGSLLDIPVTLAAKEKLTNEIYVSNEDDREVLSDLGLELSKATKEDMQSIGSQNGYGLKVNRVRQNGVVFDQTQMKKGFIITEVNNKKMKSVDGLISAVNSDEDVYIKGYYPGDERPTYYGFSAN